MGIWPHGIRSETPLVEISVAVVSWCIGASEMVASFALIAVPQPPCVQPHPARLPLQIVNLRIIEGGGLVSYRFEFGYILAYFFDDADS